MRGLAAAKSNSDGATTSWLSWTTWLPNDHVLIAHSKLRLLERRGDKTHLPPLRPHWLQISRNCKRHQKEMIVFLFSRIVRQVDPTRTYAPRLMVTACSSAFAFLYPGYKSYKALSRRPADEVELERWLMYWSVIATVIAFGQ